MSKKDDASKGMKRSAGRSRNTFSEERPATHPSGLFRAGAIVLATLRDPREKFWGALLALDPAGVTLQGIELSSFEEATSAVVAGEGLNTAVLFFPMHRVERIAMDLPEGTLPSLSQRFTTRTGLQPEEALSQGRRRAAAESAGA